MKLLALVDAPDHVCCRYRIGAFASALARAGWDLCVRPLSQDLAGRLAQIAGAARFDATLVQRKLLPRWQVGMLRRCARRLIFDFDDAVLYRDSYDARGPYCARRAARFGAIVRAADMVIAGNAFLAGCADRAGPRAGRLVVIPTCIDADAYLRAAQARAGTGTSHGGRAGLDLVWIGSSSTLQGLALQRPLWERIARLVPGVRMRVLCDRFPDLGRMKVVAVPWSEATEAAALAEGDVGISWIPDDLWSKGKCGLKVLQYQASGLPVIANPVGVHPELIAAGVTGLLADSDEAWVECVRALAVDIPLRRRMGLAARAALAANYSVAVWADRFVAAVTGGAAATTTAPGTVGTAAAWSIHSPQARQPGRAGAARVGNR